MDFAHFIEWCFYGLLSGVAVYIAKTLGKMRDSIDVLNVQIAIILTKSDLHEKRLDKHEVQIEELRLR